VWILTAKLVVLPRPIYVKYAKTNGSFSMAHVLTPALQVIILLMENACLVSKVANNVLTTNLVLFVMKISTSWTTRVV
jgi:hypothetical protein